VTGGARIHCFCPDQVGHTRNRNRTGPGCACPVASSGQANAVAFSKFPETSALVRPMPSPTGLHVPTTHAADDSDRSPSLPTAIRALPPAQPLTRRHASCRFSLHHTLPRPARGNPASIPPRGPCSPSPRRNEWLGGCCHALLSCLPPLVCGRGLVNKDGFDMILYLLKIEIF
jgi:hypothetical protein